LYLWDWSQVEDIGYRFENLVASHLLKYCHYITDTEGFNMEIRYIRDTDGREIDFVVLKNKKPIFAVVYKNFNIPSLYLSILFSKFTTFEDDFLFPISISGMLGKEFIFFLLSLQLFHCGCPIFNMMDFMRGCG
jgi:predicted AAA+ superfamily ATPase